MFKIIIISQQQYTCISSPYTVKPVMSGPWVLQPPLLLQALNLAHLYRNCCISPTLLQPPAMSGHFCLNIRVAGITKFYCIDSALFSLNCFIQSRPIPPKIDLYKHVEQNFSELFCHNLVTAQCTVEIYLKHFMKNITVI